MSTALMKHPHLCPMELLVFIFSPNMAPMTSPDTATHSGHGKHGEGEENLEVGQLLPKSGLLCSVSVLWVAYLTIMLYGDNSNLFCQ